MERHRQVKRNKVIDRGEYYDVILNTRTNMNGRIMKIDKDDWALISGCSWSFSGTTGSSQGFLKGKNISAHQALLGTREGLVIDHINHDCLDNRRANLRWATKSQNAMNMRGVDGITWSAPLNKWIAQIMVNYKHIVLGYFTDREEATKARREGEKAYFGEFAYKREG